MAREKIITGVDIGSAYVRTLIGVVNNETKEINIIGAGQKESGGIRKGVVLDVDEVVKNVITSLEEAEKMAGVSIRDIVCNINGEHLRSDVSHGVVAITNQEITDYDVARVLDAAQAMTLDQNRQIVKVIPTFFSVDKQEGIKDPVGMIGSRIEVDAHTISGVNTYIRNLETCINKAGLNLIDLVPSPLATAEAVITKRQKDLGVAVIDIGSTITSLVVYEEGVPIYTAYIPIAGETITKDLAIGLRTAVDVAEKIKIEFGHCIEGHNNKRDMIDLSTISSVDTHSVSKYQMYQIIEARVFEIFSFVKQELKKIGRDGLLPAGVVITGGSAVIPGLVDIARENLNLPAQIGFLHNVQSVVDNIDTPSYSTVLWLVLYHQQAEETMSYRSSWMWIRNFNFLSGGSFVRKIGGWFKNLLP